MAIEKRKDDGSCSWSKEQDKAFENAIATYSDDILDRWEKIAEDVPGKSLEEIKEHYELLIDDIAEIESGRVPLPCYSSYSDGSLHFNNEQNDKKGVKYEDFNGEPINGSKVSRSEQERRKGIAWTEDEHRMFLLGLEKFGKGDWRSISRNFVVTRTPTQVASHAQKYFIRLNSMNKERRRSSIHDITSVNNGDVPQDPITGETNSPGTGTTIKPNKLPNQTSPHVPAVSVYGIPAMGQPVHMAYGVRAPMNMGHMKYTTNHR